MAQKEAADSYILPHATLKNAIRDGSRVSGNIYFDSKGRFKNGEWITTSEVQKFESVDADKRISIIHTKNSTYAVEWAEDTLKRHRESLVNELRRYGSAIEVSTQLTTAQLEEAVKERKKLSVDYRLSQLELKVFNSPAPSELIRFSAETYAEIWNKGAAKAESLIDSAYSDFLVDYPAMSNDERDIIEGLVNRIKRKIDTKSYMRPSPTPPTD